ncbi:MAG TPA: hypothetical protein PLZ51_22865, partial [Aggregatilineales bacterium]|nr:hypothetical protein [Aggregatilineales bacterium]
MKKYLFILMCSFLFIVSLVSAQDDPLATMESFSGYLDQIATAPADEAQTMVADLWGLLTETASIPFVRGDEVAF